MDIQDLGSSWIHQRCYRGVMVEEKSNQAEERQDEARLWRPWRMGSRVLWAVGMVVALLTAALLIVHLHPEIWKGLLEERNLTLIAIGVSVTAIIVLLAIGGASLEWTGFGDKTFWDWLQLLSALAIPVVLAAAGLWFTAQQDARQQQIEDDRAQQAQTIENKGAEAERELAEQSAQDEAPQAYLDQMSQLMLDRNLLEVEPGDPVHTLAQARTSTAILRLDPEHNHSVTRFLIDSGLATRSEASPRLRRDITLSNAPLRNANLSEVDLSGTDLRGANLSGANLYNADLSGADLSDAYLWRTVLFKAAGITNEELEQQAHTLDGATMPGGQKYEE
jgi:hypothetical protein